MASLPVTLWSLGSEERAQWLETADSMSLRGGGPYEIPRIKPPVRAIRSDHLGRIWVEVYVAAENRREDPIMPSGRRRSLFWKERNTYDVFASAGQYLGRVVLPAESVLLDIRENRLYTRGKGPDGEDRIVVMRIQVP